MTDLSEPLANALSRIAQIVDSSESDPGVMFNMLVEIRDLSDDALNEFVNRRMAASKDELRQLRGEA
jgi:hypothetical protein